jgi:predicted N-acetyltransferase YhbS
MKLLTITDPSTLASLKGSPGLAPCSPDKLKADNPDVHLVTLDPGDTPSARCSLWWSNTPPCPEHTIGLIGHFAAADRESAATLLESACDELRRRGCDLAVGPMDGSTWRSYRFVTDAGTERPFALEPGNPASWPAYFEQNGFTPLATYTSALNDDLAGDDPRLARARERFASRGIHIRTLDPSRLDDEFRRIFQVAEASFPENFLYTPISEAEFLRQHEPIRAYLDPELVLIAEDNERPVAFLFMIPDFAQGATPDTAILKTVATVPGRRTAGLGSFLVADSHVRARQCGYQRVIHALMHDSNPSIRISRKSARPIRHYTLFGKPV